MKRVRYLFELPFPPSNNTYYRKFNNRMVLSDKGREYKKQVSTLVGCVATLRGDVHISLVLYRPDKRRRDLDNFDGKAIFDSLTSAGVWSDDSQVVSRSSRWGSPHTDRKGLIVSISGKI